jgi:hypothetical protein
MPRFQRAVFALLAVIPVLSYGAEPTWGSAINGLRIGMSLAPAGSRPGVIVAFQNTGTEEVNALLGASGNGVTYNLWFYAVNREGKKCEVLNLMGGPVAGLLLPIGLHVAPGATREVTLPMDKLICVESRVDIPLDKLLERRYTVHAAFKSDVAGAVWGNIRSPWLGEISSGEFPAQSQDAAQNSRP